MRRFLRGSATVLCIAALVVVAIVIVMPAIFGLQRYVITGGSMTGTIAKGSVIYSRLTPVEQLRVGDIITFYPPGYSQPVTHRIIAIEPAADGRLAFRTRGDYNPAADPWKVSLVEPRQARYAFHIPYVGYALAALAWAPRG